MRLRGAVVCPGLATTITRWLLAAILLPWAFWAQAQAVESVSHQAWSTEEGLPQASVHSIFQSHDGYLWIATEGGVARFDGYNFVQLGHDTSPAFTSNDTSSIAETPRGVLWFGTSDGLVRVQGSSLRRYSVRDGLPSVVILSLASADDGSLLVLTDAGLVRLDGDRFGRVPGLEEGVTSIHAANDGTVWLTGPHGTLLYSHGSAARLPPVVVSGSTPGPALGALGGSGGAVWARSAHAVSVTSGAFHRTFHFGEEGPEAQVESLLIDREGVAWIGTTRGLFTATASATARLRVDSLGSESVLSLLQDREGNHWAGTESSGLHILRPRKFSALRSTLGQSTTAVVQTSDGALCFGTRNDGVRCVRGSGTEPAVAASAMTSPVILSLAAGLHGDLWAGTPDGLNHLERGGVRKYTSADGLPDEFIRSLLVAKNGVVWMGTRYGLVQLDGGRFRTFTTRDGLPSDSIGPLYEASAPESVKPLLTAGSPSALWIGTASGLSRWNGTTFENFAPPGGPEARIVTAITQDLSGTVWVSLHNAGLSRLVDGHLQPIRAGDLPEEVVSLVADPANFLWLRSKHGIYRAPLQTLNACAGSDAVCSAGAGHYGAADGLPSDEPVGEGSPAFWQTESGDLWIATRKGMAVTHPLTLPLNKVAPPVAVERFAVDDAPQMLGTEGLRIASGHRSFTFDYAALSYTMPSRTRYRYKLEGLDRDWVDAGSRRTAYYTSLPGRRYRFRVIAANDDGVWNDVGAELRFSVQPPVYLRWWFFVVLALLLFSAVYAAFQLRFRSVQRQFALVLNERNRVAREIHDTLAQDFVSVSLQLEIISQMVRANKLPQAAQQLQATRVLVKKGLEAARQSIWDLRANATRNSLPVRVRQAVETFAQRHPAATVTIGGAYRELQQEIEDEVLRIVQESLSNVDRHAEATEVNVELHYERDRLALTVWDNGRGFLPEKARELNGHYGLRGMEERAAVLGGTLVVRSDAGEGTVVKLQVPLRPAEEA